MIGLRARGLLTAYFDDRIDAGLELGARLRDQHGENVLVLGIPRGGVVVAAEVANALSAELDIVATRKVHAPYDPELAIGAVAADGSQYLNWQIIRGLRVTNAYLARALAEEAAAAQAQEASLRGTLPPPQLVGRTVVVVDDGLATGATARAAVRSVRRRRPARVVLAVPVGSREACRALRHEASEVVCLHEPEPLVAVGFFYRDFAPVLDEEVAQILQEAREALAGQETHAA